MVSLGFSVRWWCFTGKCGLAAILLCARYRGLFMGDYGNHPNFWRVTVVYLSKPAFSCHDRGDVSEATAKTATTGEMSRRRLPRRQRPGRCLGGDCQNGNDRGDVWEVTQSLTPHEWPETRTAPTSRARRTEKTICRPRSRSEWCRCQSACRCPCSGSRRHKGAPRHCP